MPDLSQTTPSAFVCEGGLIANRSTFIMQPGQALELLNFEPDIEGGYRRINGFRKFVNHVVPYTSADSEKVLMTAFFNNNILAARGEKIFSSASTELATKILQATGMDKTLARCYSNSDLVNETSVRDVLREIGFQAEESHKKFASWGTSSSPDTSVEMLPLVENSDFLEFQNYLISNIRKEYTYAWNSPVMDGRMLQRR